MSISRPSLLSVALVSTAVVLAAAGGSAAATVVTGAQIKDGTVTGVDVRNGSLGQGDLSAGAVRSLRTVRGWAAVDADGTIQASSPGVKVTKSTDLLGTYCLSVPGVDGRTSAPVASLNFRSSGTVLAPDQPQAFVETGFYQQACKANQVGVNTMLRTYGSSTSLERADQAFYVIVP